MFSCRYILASSCPFATTSYESQLAFKNELLDDESRGENPELIADAGTTTPNGCTCISICICGIHHWDDGMPDPLTHNVELTPRDWCQTS